MINWIELSEGVMPVPNTLCLIERNNGKIYVGYRMDKPFSKESDASKNCHWYGGSVYDGYGCFGMQNKVSFNSNFSDVTVKSFCPIQSLIGEQNNVF